MGKSLVLSVLVLTMLLACRLSMSAATPSPIIPATEIIILSEVLQNSDGCRSVAGVEVGDNTYSFSCSNSADTGYTISITRYEGEATAHTRFESERGDNTDLCFQGYDLYETSSKNPYNSYIVQEQLRWQAGQWVVSIQASTLSIML
jgi:hypothetical protein